jgi:glycosyltransferase involved in cell wall biosynthesis
MKIVHLITAFGFGGAEKLLLNVMNAQVHEHQVSLIYFKPINDLIVDLDIKIEVRYFPFNFFTIRELKKYFAEYQPDIIHTHLSYADILGQLSAKGSSAKKFCTIHNIYFKKNFLDSFIFKIYRHILRDEIRVISISRSVENHVIKTLKVPKERAFLLPNSIPKKEIIKSKKENDKIKILFVGRLVKQKNVETLIKAMKILNERDTTKLIHVDIVGDGPLKGRLISLTKKFKLSHIITFEGNKKNVDQYYQKADIFVLPSIWEGFGLVILEAFRARVAVISSNIEGPSELIKHGFNGLLFEPVGYDELANHIEELVKHGLKRKKLAENGHNSFREGYHLEVYVKKLYALYANSK